MCHPVFTLSWLGGKGAEKEFRNNPKSQKTFIVTEPFHSCKCHHSGSHLQAFYETEKRDGGRLTHNEGVGHVDVRQGAGGGGAEYLPQEQERGLRLPVIWTNTTMPKGIGYHGGGGGFLFFLQSPGKSYTYLQLV